MNGDAQKKDLSRADGAEESALARLAERGQQYELRSLRRSDGKLSRVSVVWLLQGPAHRKNKRRKRVMLSTAF